MSFHRRRSAPTAQPKKGGPDVRNVSIGGVLRRRLSLELGHFATSAFVSIGGVLRRRLSLDCSVTKSAERGAFPSAAFCADGSASPIQNFLSSNDSRSHFPLGWEVFGQESAQSVHLRKLPMFNIALFFHWVHH